MPLLLLLLLLLLNKLLPILLLASVEHTEFLDANADDGHRQNEEEELVDP